jgi:hypothetical protein
VLVRARTRVEMNFIVAAKFRPKVEKLIVMVKIKDKQRKNFKK